MRYRIRGCDRSGRRALDARAARATKPSETIGRADVSVVYLSRDGSLGREVVIKAAVDGGEIEAFERCVRAAARIADLPDFVSLYDAFLTARVLDRAAPHRPYRVMRCVSGQNLHARIRADPRPARDRHSHPADDRAQPAVHSGRRLRRRSALDIDNVVEEIETMGRQQQAELVDRPAGLLAQSLKRQHQPT